jgi:hypothetical protein
MSTVQALATRCLLLSDGRLEADGDASEVANLYLSALDPRQYGKVDLGDATRGRWGEGEDWPPTDQARLTSLTFVSNGDTDSMRVRIRVCHQALTSDMSLLLSLTSESGHPVGTAITKPLSPPTRGLEASYDVEVDVSSLAPGPYSVTLAILTLVPNAHHVEHDIALPHRNLHQSRAGHRSETVESMATSVGFDGLVLPCQCSRNRRATRSPVCVGGVVFIGSLVGATDATSHSGVNDA